MQGIRRCSGAADLPHLAFRPGTVCENAAVIRAVLIDAGGVMVLPHHERVTGALRDLGIDVGADAAARAHYLGVAAIDRDPPGRAAAYLEAFVTSIGVRPADRAKAVRELQLLWSGPAIDLWSQVIYGTAEGLRTLAQRGHRLGVISNAVTSCVRSVRELASRSKWLPIPLSSATQSQRPRSSTLRWTSWGSGHRKRSTSETASGPMSRVRNPSVSRHSISIHCGCVNRGSTRTWPHCWRPQTSWTEDGAVIAEVAAAP